MNGSSNEDLKQSQALMWWALAFYSVSALGILAIIVVLVTSAFIPLSLDVPKIMLIMLAILLSGMFGYTITRGVSNKSTNPAEKILSPAMRELLGDAIRKSADPVAEVTRLTGLVGGTGVFRKLELTGMPLATILMTLAFCLLGILLPVLQANDIGDFDDSLPTAFIDMAKLTLGAFIGSFVTKSSSRDSETARASAAEAAKALAGKRPQDNPPRNAGAADGAKGQSDGKPADNAQQGGAATS